MTMTDQPHDLPPAAIDKPRLRQKYLEERNKRLRPDGNDQYLRVAGQLAHYLDDPYTPVTPREPKIDHVTFAFSDPIDKLRAHLPAVQGGRGNERSSLLALS